MKKKYNVTIIGCGGMGTAHAAAWSHLGMNIVSVCDILPERAKEIAERHNIPKTYSDYKEAITDPQVEVVSVCLPLALHAPVSIFAAEQGKDILCEKPLTQSVEKAKEMEEVINRTGVFFQVGFQRSRTRDIEILREWIKEDKFGHPLVINVDIFTHVRRKLEMHNAYGNMGPIMDVCPHTFVMWQNILESKVKTVYARGRVLAKGHERLKSLPKLAIDTALVVCEYEDGTMISYNICWGLEMKNNIPKFPQRIYGPNGGAHVYPRDKIVVYKNGEVETVEIDQPNTYLRWKQMEDFLNAKEAGEEPPVTIQKGKDALALSLAIFKSIESGKVEEVEYF